MQPHLLKSPIILITLFFIVEISAGSFNGFPDSLRSEKSNDDLFDSNIEDVNLIDNSAEQSSQNRRKNKEWLSVTMPQRTYLLQRGQSYELKCVATGTPAPEIYWIRGTDIRRQMNKLKSQMYYTANRRAVNMAKVESKYINSCASEADVGPIHCVAVSGRFIGKKSAIIEIDPSLQHQGSCSIAQNPVITKFKRTVLSAQGSTLTLPCDVFGNPKPQTYWKIDGDEGTSDLRSNERFKLLEDGGLMIKSLEWNDMGDYTCLANSTLGEDRITTFVYPLRVVKY